MWRDVGAILQFPKQQTRDFSPELGELVLHAPRFRRGDYRSPTGPFVYRGLRYCSRCEAACGALMEKYISGYKVRDGKTFQVPIGPDDFGNMKSVDFLVAGVLLEFHPPRLWRNSRRCGDFNSISEYLAFRKMYDSLPAEERRGFREDTLETLKQNYTKKRRKTIDENPILRKLELVVVGSPSELYDKIIARFSNNKPSKETFLREFQQLLYEVKDTRPIHRRPFSARAA